MARAGIYGVAIEAIKAIAAWIGNNSFCSKMTFRVG
jgi:hypothetical protein